MMKEAVSISVLVRVNIVISRKPHYKFYLVDTTNLRFNLLKSIECFYSQFSKGRILFHLK